MKKFINIILTFVILVTCTNNAFAIYWDAYDKYEAETVYSKTNASVETISGEYSNSSATKLSAVNARNLCSASFNFTARNQFVNMINYISDEKLPAYLATEEQVMVIPRIKDGKTVSVTLFNVSMGDYEDLKLVINNPANEKECIVTYPFEEDKKLPLEKEGDSFTVKIDSLERWRIKTILL